jgi:hypothetical protein
MRAADDGVRAWWERNTTDDEKANFAQIRAVVPHVKPKERATSTAPLPTSARVQTRFTASELLAREFPEPRWAVPGLIADGLTLLAGAPKLGKSWFALNLAVAIASGGKALGGKEVTQGSVLYLALEDIPRRLQSRLSAVLNGDQAPDGLTFEVECAPIADGGADLIRDWIAETRDARLVIVDVFARVRGRSDPRADRYSVDYAAAQPLKTIADRTGVAVLLVHHTRKAAADDWLDMVSGSQGLAGSCDAVLMLTRARNTRQAVLRVTGRDIEEAQYPLELDPHIGTWTLLDGTVSEHEMSDERRKIVTAVRASEGITPKQIAEATSLSHDVVKQLVRKMVDAGQLDTDGDGHYLLPFTPFTAFTGEDDQ